MSDAIPRHVAKIRGEGRITPLQRIAAKVKVSDDGCWEWQGGRTTAGYGVLYFRSRQDMAHRVMYTLTHGAIPDGLEIDHLCRNKSCVNPAHLDAVTRLENMRRWSRTITHCPRGHEYTDENTSIYRDERGTMRKCRTCHRERQREYMAQRAKYASIAAIASSNESGNR